MELTDLIKTYDDVLSKEDCENLIEIFKNSSEKKDIRTQLGDTGRINPKSKMSFTILYVDEGNSLIKDIRGKMMKCQIDYIFFMNDILKTTVFPKSYVLEKVKIKRYISESNEQFPSHIDAGDIDTCLRYLSNLVYLNDDFEGGQTVFNDVTIEPKIGRLLIFPPMWMYPHSGTVPINNDKYILTTYLRFSTNHPHTIKIPSNG